MDPTELYPYDFSCKGTDIFSSHIHSARLAERNCLDDCTLLLTFVQHYINNMSEKIIHKTYCDWNYDEDEHHRYKLVFPRVMHSLQPLDKVKLKIVGQPDSTVTMATILECQDDGIIVQANGWVDISEEYSIESVGYEEV